jgi:carbon storage regulator
MRDSAFNKDATNQYWMEMAGKVPPREERGMLVLRRKAGEAIVLNQVIKIRVLGVEGDRVKLGIDAPPDVIVVREELLEDANNSPHSMPSQTPQPTVNPWEA